MQNREKVAITGSASFIGQHLVERLDNRGCEIVSINRGDSLDIIKDYQPDVIYHLAAAGSKRGNYSEEEIFETNVVGTWNLLQATRDIPYKAFISFSSSSVLLDHETHYSASKKAAEAMCRAEAQKYGKPIVSVRPSTITGPGEQSVKLIPTLIRSCLVGEKMKFVPEPRHDFLNVEDFLDALDLVVENVAKIDSRAVNICSGLQMSNQQILETVEEVTGKKANIEIVPSLREYDTDNWSVNNAELIKLGWSPRVDIIESIRSMI